MRQKASSADEELADLQKKYAVLEGDRKAYYETSQWTIKQNRDTIAAAKRENKELRTQLALLHEQKGIKHGTAPGLDPARADLRRLALFVADLRKRHDDMHQQLFRKGGLMRKQISDTKALELDAEGITEDDTPIRQHIRMLENRLDKALVKYNEAQSIRKTYEQIVKRLREERVSFDNQLAAIGRTLKAKEHDLDELVLMSHDANHAKEVAKAELARVDAQLLQERLAREKDLADRRAQARAKQEMSARLDLRSRTPKDAMDDDGDLLDGVDHKRELDSAEDGGKREEEMRRVMTFEEAFRKIKDATGVSDVNEVIQKFLTQEETTANLKQLTREAQARIDLLSTETNSAKAQIEEVKYSGSSTLGSRRIVDEYEVRLMEANVNCERLRQRYERVARVLINLKAGAEHLVDKLEVVKIDQVTVPLNDDTIVDVFGQCEFKLLRTLEAFKSDDEVQRMLDDADAMGLFAQQDMRGGDIHLQNNVRIPSALSEAPQGENEEEEEDYYSDEDDDDKEVPDRLFVKTASVQVLERATKRAKRKNNRFSTIIRSENNSPQPSPAGSNLPSTPSYVKGKPSHGKKADPE